MPTQPHINDIAFRLHRFKTGQRQHIQTVFHCGTAHCLAGDKSVDDFCEHKGYSLEDFHKEYAGTLPESAQNLTPSDEFYIFLEENTHEGVNTFEWAYAKQAWELSKSEASFLFNANLDLETMIYNLKYIASGHNLTVPEYL